MYNIKVITDSNCDLSNQIMKKYDIPVVAQYVNFDNESYKDMVEITSAELFKKVSILNKLPKTAAPSPSDFHYTFKQYIDEGKDILCVCTSSFLSATYQNALIASKDFPPGRIEVVNSLNISMGIGILVLKAIDCVNDGLNIHEIAELLNNCTSKVKTIFTIDTLEYLRRGGRCSAVQSFVGDILKLHPVIHIADGKLVLAEKVRGRREKALKDLLDRVYRDKDIIDLKRIILTHSMSPDDAELLAEKIKKDLCPEEVIITETGCSVSTHCGPNTIGIIYMIK
jgi:EDD domain protein, DegV family